MALGARAAAPPEMVDFGGSPHSLNVLKPGEARFHFRASPGPDGRPLRPTSCRLYVEIPLAGQETVYGAICVSKDASRNEVEVMLCDDTGAGQSGVQAIGRNSAGKDELIDFMRNHCPGG